ncbi:MAG: 50S ribosomal protein P1 [Candidatus Diapherotrites archaeon]
MEYVYTAMLLHSAKKPVDEAGVSKVLEAAGVKADSAKVKALVASLKDVNIDEAIKQASVMPVAAAAAPAQGAAHGKVEEKKKDEEKKTEAEAAEGLAGLFG